MSVTKNDKRFKEDVELDSDMVLQGMKGGISAVMNYGFRRNDIFPNTKDVTDRCEWFKLQSREYIDKVVQKVMEKEKQ